MPNDLVRIVQETEQSVSRLPTRYATSLEDFTREDEKILGAFWLQERDSKPFYTTYKEWEETFFGKQEKYDNPKKHWMDLVKKTPEFMKILTTLKNKNGIDNLVLSKETRDIFGDLPTMISRAVDIETRFYEAVVANAKQLSLERGTNPVDIVKDRESVNEIYRRIFSKREQFEFSCDMKNKIGITFGELMFAMKDDLTPKFEAIRKIPILSWMLEGNMRKTEEQFAKFPSRHIFIKYIKDELAYDEERASQIYGNGNPGIIDAEFREI